MKISPRDAAIVKRHLAGETQASLAKRYRITRQRVAQIIEENMSDLKPMKTYLRIDQVEWLDAVAAPREKSLLMQEAVDLLRQKLEREQAEKAAARQQMTREDISKLE